MSKRKCTVLNYIDSEEDSYTKGKSDGENIAKIYKKEPTFNFKSYLDGLCNGYTLEFKSLKDTNKSTTVVLIETNPLVNQTTLQTFINHERESFNKGTRDGKLIVKNNNLEFINFKSYLDGVCNGYTDYKMSNSFFNNLECSLRLTYSPQLSALFLPIESNDQ